MVSMQCSNCGFQGDDVKDFQGNDVPGEIICPVCGSFSVVEIQPPIIDEPIGEGVQP